MLTVDKSPFEAKSHPILSISPHVFFSCIFHPHFPFARIHHYFLECPKLGFFVYNGKGKWKKCRTKVEKGPVELVSRAHPPRKVSTLISRRQQAGNQQRANGWNQILPSLPSFFSSFLSGAECLKPVKWGRLPFHPASLALVRGFSCSLPFAFARPAG